MRSFIEMTKEKNLSTIQCEPIESFLRKATKNYDEIKSKLKAPIQKILLKEKMKTILGGNA